MFFRQIVDPKLAQYAYLIGCQATGEALIIDPERDIDRYINAAAEEDLKIVAAADTHIHADYLTGMREFAERGVTVYASDEGGPDWRYEWLYESNYPHRLLRDGDIFTIGNITIKAVHTPGHTPEHLSFLVFDGGIGASDPIGAATGDFVFVGDLGRPDLLESAAGVQGQMEPSARRLYDTVSTFHEWPDFMQIWPGHGAGSACGKSLGAVPESTVGYERRYNSAILAADEGLTDFVKYILADQPEPPYYFARMKRDNRRGPAVLGSLPQPARKDAADLGRIAIHGEYVLLDTRSDRTGFMRRHIPGAIHAPLDKTFSTVAGSFLEENALIYLVVEESRVEESVRDLVRIGLDRVEGYFTPESVDAYFEAGGEWASIPETTFDGVPERGPHLVLDVRRRSEFESGHIPGAVNVAHTRLLPRLREIPGDRVVYVHCRSGARAASASSFLAREGFDIVLVNDLFEMQDAYQQPSRYEAIDTSSGQPA